jgi:hypothetical protein
MQFPSSKGFYYIMMPLSSIIPSILGLYLHPNGSKKNTINTQSISLKYNLSFTNYKVLPFTQRLSEERRSPMMRRLLRPYGMSSNVSLTIYFILLTVSSYYSFLLKLLSFVNYLSALLTHKNAQSSSISLIQSTNPFTE